MGHDIKECMWPLSDQYNISLMQPPGFEPSSTSEFLFWMKFLNIPEELCNLPLPLSSWYCRLNLYGSLLVVEPCILPTYQLCRFWHHCVQNPVPLGACPAWVKCRYLFLARLQHRKLMCQEASKCSRVSTT